MRCTQNAQKGTVVLDLMATTHHIQAMYSVKIEVLVVGERSAVGITVKGVVLICVMNALSRLKKVE